MDLRGQYIKCYLLNRQVRPGLSPRQPIQHHTSWSCSDFRCDPPLSFATPFLQRHSTRRLPTISAKAMMEMPSNELLSSSSPAAFRFYCCCCVGERKASSLRIPSKRVIGYCCGRLPVLQRRRVPVCRRGKKGFDDRTYNRVGRYNRRVLG